MRVIDILEEKLEADGFGGLVADGSECCCEIGNLAPCEADAIAIKLVMEGTL